MKFQEGNVYRFPPGSCPNPAGRAAGLPTLRRAAVQSVMEIVDRVLSEPDALARWEAYVRERWATDPGEFLRQIVLPLAPRESLTFLRATEDGLAALTVSQLRAIAATLPEDPGGDPQDGQGAVLDVMEEEPRGNGADAPPDAPGVAIPAGAVAGQGGDSGSGFDPEAGF